MAEPTADCDRLSAWMHPNSKAIVPETAMGGWYRDGFAVWPPVWMTVDDVQLGEWTWEMTGKVYPSAAEVNFRQRFADGQVTENVVHLVRDNGVWRWLFGGERTSVEEQIKHYAAAVETPTLLPTAVPTDPVFVVNTPVLEAAVTPTASIPVSTAVSPTPTRTTREAQALLDRLLDTPLPPELLVHNTGDLTPRLDEDVGQLGGLVGAVEIETSQGWDYSQITSSISCYVFSAADESAQALIQ